VNPVAVLCWSTGMKEAPPVERKGPLTWVETRGIEPRTSCLQIADSHSCGVSTVLGATSLRGLVYPSLDRATGTTVARAEAIHHHPATTDAGDRPRAYHRSHAEEVVAAST